MTIFLMKYEYLLDLKEANEIGIWVK